MDQPDMLQTLFDMQMKLNQRVVSGLGDLLLDRGNELRHPEPRTAVEFAIVQALAMLVYHYTVGTREMLRTPMGEDKLARELATSCLAYLGIDNPYAPFGGPQS